MTEAIVLGLSLALLNFVIHYRTLRWLASSQFGTWFSGDRRILSFVIILFGLHLVEICLYAAAYSISVSVLLLGGFEGGGLPGFMEHLYYSGVVYTTLGLGDISTIGHLRFITAIEALNGFMLITWSASFTFVAMSRLWSWDTCNSSTSHSKLDGIDESRKA